MVRFRRRTVAALFAAGALAASTARAAPSSSGAEAAGTIERRDRGKYFSLDHGFGFGLSYYRSSSAGTSGSRTFEARFSGPYIEAGTAIGRVIRRGLALSFESAVWVQPLLHQDGDVGDSHLKRAWGFRDGIALDLWPEEERPWRARLGLDVAIGMFPWEGATVHPDGAFGPMTTASVARDVLRYRQFFFAVAMRLHAGFLVSEQSNVLPLGATLGVSFGGF